MTSNSLQAEPLQAMTKKELYQRFFKFGRDTVRYEMNKIITEVRGVPMKEAKCQKSLRASEVAELEKRFA